MVNNKIYPLELGHHISRDGEFPTLTQRSGEDGSEDNGMYSTRRITGYVNLLCPEESSLASEPRECLLLTVNHVAQLNL